MKNKGFSLIEMLVVIAIIAVILGLAVPNYLGARERARDARKKDEMRELKAALRLYYNDHGNYPQAYNDMGNGIINHIKGCSTNGTGNCPCTYGGKNYGFAEGDACDTVYMKTFPNGLGSTTTPNVWYYIDQTGLRDDFCLKTDLDNKSDPDAAISRTRCSIACGNNCNGSTNYCVCAD